MVVVVGVLTLIELMISVPFVGFSLYCCWQLVVGSTKTRFSCVTDHHHYWIMCVFVDHCDCKSPTHMLSCCLLLLIIMLLVLSSWLWLCVLFVCDGDVMCVMCVVCVCVVNVVVGVCFIHCFTCYVDVCWLCQYICVVYCHVVIVLFKHCVYVIDKYIHAWWCCVCVVWRGALLCAWCCFLSACVFVMMMMCVGLLLVLTVV